MTFNISWKSWDEAIWLNTPVSQILSTTDFSTISESHRYNIPWHVTQGRDYFVHNYRRLGYVSGSREWLKYTCLEYDERTRPNPDPDKLRDYGERIRQAESAIEALLRQAGAEKAQRQAKDRADELSKTVRWSDTVSGNLEEPSQTEKQPPPPYYSDITPSSPSPSSPTAEKNRRREEANSRGNTGDPSSQDGHVDSSTDDENDAIPGPARPMVNHGTLNYHINKSNTIIGWAIKTSKGSATGEGGAGGFLDRLWIRILFLSVIVLLASKLASVILGTPEFIGGLVISLLKGVGIGILSLLGSTLGTTNTFSAHDTSTVAPSPPWSWPWSTFFDNSGKPSTFPPSTTQPSTHSSFWTEDTAANENDKARIPPILLHPANTLETQSKLAALYSSTLTAVALNDDALRISARGLAAEWEAYWQSIETAIKARAELEAELLWVREVKGGGRMGLLVSEFRGLVEWRMGCLEMENGFHFSAKSGATNNNGPSTPEAKAGLGERSKPPPCPDGYTWMARLQYPFHHAVGKPARYPYPYRILDEEKSLYITPFRTQLAAYLEHLVQINMRGSVVTASLKGNTSRTLGILLRDYHRIRKDAGSPTRKSEDKGQYRERAGGWSSVFSRQKERKREKEKKDKQTCKQDGDHKIRHPGSNPIYCAFGHAEAAGDILGTEIKWLGDLKEWVIKEQGIVREVVMLLDVLVEGGRVGRKGKGGHKGSNGGSSGRSGGKTVPGVSAKGGRWEGGVLGLLITAVRALDEV
ncbi:hypothetical protein MKZ38_008719 [Zalerion maritima]|uniref:Uncharacterized protein n=1 Tax=Zalerion maritima TaxID=339359 RepID=A0AAD5WV28_9PEZI|nr:hypothetical protein MKZ38_008719 [Zalerion maritima]